MSDSIDSLLYAMADRISTCHPSVLKGNVMATASPQDSYFNGRLGRYHYSVVSDCSSGILRVMMQFRDFKVDREIPHYMRPKSQEFSYLLSMMASDIDIAAEKRHMDQLSPSVFHNGNGEVNINLKLTKPEIIKRDVFNDTKGSAIKRLQADADDWLKDVKL